MFGDLSDFITPRQEPILDGATKENVVSINDNYNQHKFAGCTVVVPKRYANVTFYGEGKHGQIFHAKDLLTGKIVNIKHIARSDVSTPLYLSTDTFPKLYNEINLLFMPNQKNLLNLHSVYTPVQIKNDLSEMYFVMPFYRYSLRELIQCDRVHFSHHNVRSLIYQSLCGLSYLEEIRDVHQDLKPSNMVVDLQTGNLKLVNWGIICMEPTANTPIGFENLCYRAPETALNALPSKYYNENMWSLGCIMYEMFAKRPLVLCETDEEHKLELLNLFGTPDEEFMKSVHCIEGKEWILEQPKSRPVVWSQLLPNNLFPYGVQAYHALARQAREVLQDMLMFNSDKRGCIGTTMKFSYFNGYHKETNFYPFLNLEMILPRESEKYSFEQLNALVFNGIKKFEQEYGAFQLPE